MKNARGATLIEIIVVIGIFTTLFGLITVNLLNLPQKASLQSSLTTFISDFKHQQSKAMFLDTNGSLTTSDFGMYFEQNRYTLFRGNTFSPGSSDNFTVALGENVQFASIFFPSSIVVFQRQSGEVLGFNPALNSITLKNTQTNEQKTIQINRYGVITNVN